MPRAARQPGPGAANRSDLAAPTPAPIQTAPGQSYGEAAQQQQAQRAIPTANGPTMAPGGAPPQAPASAADAVAQAQGHDGPGDSLSLMRPTERPNEPVTHGLPVGPGGGPEVLQGIGAAARNGAVEQGTLRNLLSNIAQSPGATSAIRDLAARAAGGAM